MATTTYTEGMQDLGNGNFAYFQPDGGWGLSNAGLVTSKGEALLIDTLYELQRTQKMLDALREATPAAAHIDVLVNTHGDGDHYFGNELVGDIEIITSSAAAEQMRELPPQQLAELRNMAPQFGALGEYFLQHFGNFNFSNITMTVATRTFNDRLELKVGDKTVRLIEVGPAHTSGDLIVHVPDDGVVFAGDVLFVGVTPLMWTGPVQNWLEVCDLILDLDADTIVPGHGPLAAREDVVALKEYFTYLREETWQRFDAGMPVDQAAVDVPDGKYADWLGPERSAVNVAALYREFGDDDAPADRVQLFGLMVERLDAEKAKT